MIMSGMCLRNHLLDGPRGMRHAVRLDLRACRVEMSYPGSTHGISHFNGRLRSVKVAKAPGSRRLALSRPYSNFWASILKRMIRFSSACVDCMYSRHPYYSRCLLKNRLSVRDFSGILAPLGGKVGMCRVSSTKLIRFSVVSPPPSQPRRRGRRIRDAL